MPRMNNADLRKRGYTKWNPRTWFKKGWWDEIPGTFKEANKAQEAAGGTPWKVSMFMERLGDAEPSPEDVVRHAARGTVTDKNLSTWSPRRGLRAFAHTVTLRRAYPDPSLRVNPYATKVDALVIKRLNASMGLDEVDNAEEVRKLRAAAFIKESSEAFRKRSRNQAAVGVVEDAPEALPDSPSPSLSISAIAAHALIGGVKISVTPAQKANGKSAARDGTAKEQVLRLTALSDIMLAADQKELMVANMDHVLGEYASSKRETFLSRVREALIAERQFEKKRAAEKGYVDLKVYGLEARIEDGFVKVDEGGGIAAYERDANYFSKMLEQHKAKLAAVKEAEELKKSEMGAVDALIKRAKDSGKSAEVVAHYKKRKEAIAVIRDAQVKHIRQMPCDPQIEIADYNCKPLGIDERVLNAVPGSPLSLEKTTFFKSGGVNAEYLNVCIAARAGTVLDYGVRLRTPFQGDVVFVAFDDAERTYGVSALVKEMSEDFAVVAAKSKSERDLSKEQRNAELRAEKEAAKRAKDEARTQKELEDTRARMYEKLKDREFEQSLYNVQLRDLQFATEFTQGLSSSALASSLGPSTSADVPAQLVEEEVLGDMVQLLNQSRKLCSGSVNPSNGKVMDISLNGEVGTKDKFAPLTGRSFIRDVFDFRNGKEPAEAVEAVDAEFQREMIPIQIVVAEMRARHNDKMRQAGGMDGFVELQRKFASEFGRNGLCGNEDRARNLFSVAVGDPESDPGFLVAVKDLLESEKPASKDDKLNLLKLLELQEKVIAGQHKIAALKRIYILEQDPLLAQEMQRREAAAAKGGPASASGNSRDDAAEESKAAAQAAPASASGEDVGGEGEDDLSLERGATAEAMESIKDNPKLSKLRDQMDREFESLKDLEIEFQREAMGDTNAAARLAYGYAKASRRDEGFSTMNLTAAERDGLGREKWIIGVRDDILLGENGKRSATEVMDDFKTMLLAEIVSRALEKEVSGRDRSESSSSSSGSTRSAVSNHLFKMAEQVLSDLKGKDKVQLLDSFKGPDLLRFCVSVASEGSLASSSSKKSAASTGSSDDIIADKIADLVAAVAAKKDGPRAASSMPASGGAGEPSGRGLTAAYKGFMDRDTLLTSASAGRAAASPRVVSQEYYRKLMQEEIAESRIILEESLSPESAKSAARPSPVARAEHTKSKSSSALAAKGSVAAASFLDSTPSIAAVHSSAAVPPFAPPSVHSSSHSPTKPLIPVSSKRALSAAVAAHTEADEKEADGKKRILFRGDFEQYSLHVTAMYEDVFGLPRQVSFDEISDALNELEKREPELLKQFQKCVLAYEDEEKKVEDTLAAGFLEIAYKTFRRDGGADSSPTAYLRSSDNEPRSRLSPDSLLRSVIQFQEERTAEAAPAAAAMGHRFVARAAADMSFYCGVEGVDRKKVTVPVRADSKLYSTGPAGVAHTHNLQQVLHAAALNACLIDSNQNAKNGDDPTPKSDGLSINRLFAEQCRKVGISFPTASIGYSDFFPRSYREAIAVKAVEALESVTAADRGAATSSLPAARPKRALFSASVRSESSSAPEIAPGLPEYMKYILMNAAASAAAKQTSRPR